MRYLLFVVLSVLAAFSILRFINLRDEFYSEYLKTKEFILLAKNYQSKKKSTITEDFLRQKTLSVGAQLNAFSQLDVGFEIKGSSLKGDAILQFIHSLEQEGIEILRFKAVDNTGQGIYDFELVVR
ncbi:MAG: hypothetical protein NZL90_01710 [Aquificaceae bacterium]|nr:hypothetical protein [Aquificaceae bacterium]MDW8237434.1 hypothetical protein [Aquificaceae bacterium]